MRYKKDFKSIINVFKFIIRTLVAAYIKSSKTETYSEAGIYISKSKVGDCS